MTAEVVIMNKLGVALAADSAATSGAKIFTSANKIFSLSKYEPVGIMIYEAVEFMGVPWEVIVKKYRKSLGETGFGTLEEYHNDFISYLAGYFSREEQRDHYFGLLKALYSSIIRDLDEYADRETSRGEGFSTEDTADFIKRKIDELSSNLEKQSDIDSFGADYRDSFRDDLDDDIRELINQQFGRYPIESVILDKLVDISIWFYTKDTRNMSVEFPCSGIVIAGYGEGEDFPSVLSFECDFCVNGRLRVYERLAVEIDSSNRGLIIPYAQTEMVYTFVQGVDPDYQKIVEDLLSEALAIYSKVTIKSMDFKDEQSKNDFETKQEDIRQSVIDVIKSNLSVIRKELFENSIINTVSILPKDELGKMAEALVGLTSLKRRVSMSLETVSGPVDVAIISKGDGFIWMQRKHYFQSELNPHFISNYFKED